MTKREINLRIFQRKPVPYVLFQPRIEAWYDWHKRFGGFPDELAGLSLLDVYDRLDLSMRYVHYYTGMPDPITVEYAPEVRRRVAYVDAQHRRTIFETPHGELVTCEQLTADESWRVTGHPVKNQDTLEGVTWLHRHSVFHFSAENFLEGDAFIADRGVPQFWVPKSPYQALCQQWMKFEDFIYALAETPAAVERAMAAIDESYGILYTELTSSPLPQIINFGENIHASLLSPAYWERYLVPFYEKRCAQLRGAGIFTYIHMDGHFRPLLRYLAESPFDALEALTPKPQGDVTLEEIRDWAGDKILLDVLPAVLFTPDFSMEDVQNFTERTVNYFGSRLVLGISDEIPQNADAPEIEKLRWVANYCRKHALDG